MITIQKPLNVKSNKEKIDMLTFKHIISEAQKVTIHSSHEAMTSMRSEGRGSSQFIFYCH